MNTNRKEASPRSIDNEPINRCGRSKGRPLLCTEINLARKLYLEQKMSWPAIAARLGRSIGGLQRHLRGISRTHSEAASLFYARTTVERSDETCERISAGRSHYLASLSKDERQAIVARMNRGRLGERNI